MSVAAAPIVGAALLIVCLALLRFYILYKRGILRERIAEAQDTSARALFFSTTVRFGGAVVVIAVGTAVGILVWDLSLDAIGFYGDPVRTIALGVIATPVFILLDKLLIAGVRITGESRRPEAPDAETGSELGWALGSVTVRGLAEEVYFRAALIGALAALLSVSKWYLVIPTGLLFGFVHGNGLRDRTVVWSIKGITLGGLFVVGGLLAVIPVHVLDSQLSVIRNYTDGFSRVPTLSDNT